MSESDKETTHFGYKEVEREAKAGLVADVVGGDV